MQRLILPLPPSVNHAYRTYVHPQTGQRIRVLTSKAQKFRRDAAYLALRWRQETGWTMPQPGTKVVLRLWYFWPSRRRMDTHNREKVLLDALEGVLYPEDRWVLIQEMDFEVDRKRPRLEIEVLLHQDFCAT
ncbi:RusA family crossover junction endodeoxyribonuclease [Alicyclobacillus sendaiensis]|uniref:RusA family crossover junction endodeoxyribonuclease n=1 Tax=Alicyclobacillus sendaiensis TaxID=192387 RepID=UPI00272D2A8B|nr:RusA family crossover junction endodeoxyribonuclease [Alicyclobacillus sendaiensis]